ncbi:MAG: lysine--tRNA ligase [Candidatus Sungbacteria bacterium]|nr:lysine--tRNA ligase [Candidatus Sungbacteria bacterium]
MPLDDIRSERIKKLNILREKGIDPYPASTARTHLISEVLKKFGVFAKSKKKLTVAGRIMAMREHGGSVFLDLRDGSGPIRNGGSNGVNKIQVYFKEDILKESYRLFLDTVDIGDFIEASGKLFKTKRGEETIEVLAWRILAKSLLPLPEKWHGLQDAEERFRKRYLDILMNNEVRARFILRSKIVSAVREFFEKEGFLEVETPVLHPIAGGALARPFKTHHNALDADFYLRIAPELYLKRLLVAGFEKVCEMGKNFRNEGIDAEHNPEFSAPECYAAYWDENDMMKFTERMFLYVVKSVSKKPEFEFQGKKIAVKAPFPKIPFKELLRRYALIVDYDKETQNSMAMHAKRLGIDTAPFDSKGKIADFIYKKICRPYVMSPTFVVNHPLDISPLAKKRSENAQEVRRFQLVVAGYEITNGFAELNDPQDQRARFSAQKKEYERGEEEAHPVDNDFVEALEYGMPPSAGLGIGLDRWVMLLTNTKNVREILLFPTLRPKG